MRVRRLGPRTSAVEVVPRENRRSIQKLAALEPSLILPGHGPAITDMAAFTRFVAALPVD